MLSMTATQFVPYVVSNPIPIPKPNKSCIKNIWVQPKVIKPQSFPVLDTTEILPTKSELDVPKTPQPKSISPTTPLKLGDISDVYYRRALRDSTVKRSWPISIPKS